MALTPRPRPKTSPDNQRRQRRWSNPGQRQGEERASGFSRPSSDAFETSQSRARSEYVATSVIFDNVPLSSFRDRSLPGSARDACDTKRNSMYTTRPQHHTVCVKGGGFFVSTSVVSNDQSLIARAETSSGILAQPRPRTTPSQIRDDKKMQ
eukprot:478240-Rhodomonas_salina.1